MFLIFGGFVSWYGFVQLQSGHPVWENWRGYSVFASGLIAMGVFIALLSLLPPYRRGKKL
jgi:hypothetical protein